MAAKKKKAGRPKGSKNVKKTAKKKAGRPKGSKNVKKTAAKTAKKAKRGRPKGTKNVKKKAGRPKVAKRRGPVKTRTVTIPASLADKIEGLTLLGKGGAIEKAIDKLIR